MARLSAARRFDVASANLAIGTAGIFAAAVAIASLAVDGGDAGSGIAGGNWSLRGTLAPFDRPGSAGGRGVIVPPGGASTGLS